jgi:two-component system OmpR family sensor kinase
MINNIFKKQSIFFTITITFLISIILIIISFTILYNIDEKREERLTYKRNIDVTKMFLQNYIQYGFSKDLKKDLEDIDFTSIIDKKEQNKILQNKNLTIQYVRHQHQMRTIIKYLKLKNKYLVYIQTPYHQLLLINNRTIKNHKYILIIIFVSILLAFIALYFTTIKKLKPLSTLKNQIKNLANEDYDINCATTKQDEISQLANEFDKTAKTLQNIKESRNIFIRNIMHELKTPITKGKFLTQLPNTDENNNKMQKVFYRLEALINEFATIEELISTKKLLKIKEYYLSDIIDEASDILMCNDEEVIKEFQDIKIKCDFKLFSIAIKNILDNGIKYSDDKKIIVTLENKDIVFKNEGNKLLYPLEKYFEPFFNGNNHKSNDSFGLGLYIVKHILDANNKKLSYSHIDNINKFTIC